MKTKDLDPARAQRMEGQLREALVQVQAFNEEFRAAYIGGEVDDKAGLSGALLLVQAVSCLGSLASGVHFEFRSDFGEVPLDSMPDINLVTTDVPDN